MEDHKANWKLYVDGALCRGTEGLRIILKGLDEVTIEYVLRLTFKATNNTTKYNTPIKGFGFG